MATYTSIANSQVDPKAPLTAELMYALRDNPTAIAEGAAGAPRMVPFARKSPLLHSGGSTTILNLDSYGTLDLQGFLWYNNTGTSTHTSQLRYRLSSDNGATWGAWSIVLSITTDANTQETELQHTQINISGGPNAIELGTSFGVGSHNYSFILNGYGA